MIKLPKIPEGYRWKVEKDLSHDNSISYHAVLQQYSAPTLFDTLLGIKGFWKSAASGCEIIWTSGYMTNYKGQPKSEEEAFFRAATKAYREHFDSQEVFFEPGDFVEVDMEAL